MYRILIHFFFLSSADEPKCFGILSEISLRRFYHSSNFLLSYYRDMEAQFLRHRAWLVATAVTTERTESFPLVDNHMKDNSSYLK
jgi:hypothetical protein